MAFDWVYCADDPFIVVFRSSSYSIIILSDFYVVRFYLHVSTGILSEAE